MAKKSLHERPFDDVTLKKLEIFRLYAREWFPVFLASQRPTVRQVHVHDFFCGPGQDSAGVAGSPLILLEEFMAAKALHDNGVKAFFHFSDKSSGFVSQLRACIAARGLDFPEGSNIRASEFEEAFDRAMPTLRRADCAKLVLADQFGVSSVTDRIFQQLVKAPKCDFMFYFASSATYRFNEHPSIPQRIDRPDSYIRAHRATADYFRAQIKPSQDYHLAPFSFKRGSNVNGIIFGSGHLLGIDKFLQVAWKQDEHLGEANFDVDGEGMDNPTPFIPNLFDVRPSKIRAFEAELEGLLRSGFFKDELALVKCCFALGFRGQHAAETIRRLKKADVIACDFRVPQIRRMPRMIRLI